MFETISIAPDDPILGLNEQFKNDPRPDKVNLIVGVYQDESGKIPQLRSVQAAEAKLLQDYKPNYLPIDGDPRYTQLAAELVLGADDPHLQQKHVVAAQTPGGTGGLRVTADFLAKTGLVKTIWHSDPTWANHAGIFNGAGIQTIPHKYLDATGTALDFAGMMQAIRQIPSGSALLLHACCHNPTGVDPSPQQWSEIVAAIRQQRLLPIVDCAYQGFGDGIEQDALACRLISQQIDEAIFIQSFSKNFSLYNQRVGAVLLLTSSADAAGRARSQLKSCIRVNYSNPPQFGAGLVSLVLGDVDLRKMWFAEVNQMRQRIADLRQMFASQLATKCSHDFSHIQTQRGMFSFTGLSRSQVERLQTEFGVYIVGNGRMNVAGLSSDNMSRTTDAIAAVLD